MISRPHTSVTAQVGRFGGKHVRQDRGGMDIPYGGKMMGILGEGC